MNITTIIFDWHGVLDETKLELLKQALVKLSGKTPEEVESVIKRFEPHWGKGDMDPHTFWRNIQISLHLTNTQLLETQQSILVFRKYLPLWQKLPQLQAKYTLAVLSDCPMDKIQVIRKEADLSFFKVVYFSAEKRLSKDMDEFFINLVKELGVSPEQCMYVDDNAKHISTASRLGFHACLFSTIEDFEKILHS